MKTLLELVDHARTDKNNGHCYLETYERLFCSLRQTRCTILEIGIDKGGSIKLWNDYFANANIIGLDIKPKCSEWGDIEHLPRVTLFSETNAYDETFFNSNFVDRNIKCDVVIDDGPHTLGSMLQFVTLYSKLLSDCGVLIVEDVQNMSWIEALRFVTPKHLRHCVEVYDLRHINNRWDDILFVINCNKRHNFSESVPKPIQLKESYVCVSGVCGLGNTLFQIACAMNFATSIPNTTVLLQATPDLMFGTAESKGHSQGYRNKHTGELIPYSQSIFAKFKIVNEFPSPRTVFHNEYGSVIPKWDYENQHLEIQGLQQNVNLFKTNLHSVHKSLNLYDPKIITYLQQRYGVHGAFGKCVCIGIRRGQDFKHMTKITNRIINTVKKQFYPTHHALIISDIHNASPVLQDDCELDFPFTYVQEPDIVQMNLVYLCDSFILSESTFHVWMAYLMEDVFYNTNITCFNDTDITTRNLSFSHWRHVSI